MDFYALGRPMVFRTVDKAPGRFHVLVSICFFFFFLMGLAGFDCTIWVLEC